MPLPGSFSPPAQYSVQAPPTIFTYPPSLPGFATTPPTITTPAFPGTGTAATNSTGVNVLAYISGGTITAVLVNGATVATVTMPIVYVPAGQTVQFTYTGSPAWVWQVV